ncbi:MAG: hypothetical protein JSR54_12355 [Proteobacteria bacterium]|nr:hypothetical protein [Pseudomonadota bacterium]
MAWWGFFRGRRRDDAANGEAGAPGAKAGRAGRIRRDVARDGEAAAEAIGGLKDLERRFGPTVAPAAVRLRSAVLLHRFGRKAEAWTMFRRLAADPAACGAESVRPLMLGEVYERMRRALEREGLSAAALAPAAAAYALRIQYWSRRGRAPEVAALRTPERFERHFGPLLARARLGAHARALRELIEGSLARLPELDVAALEQAVEEWTRATPPTAVAVVPAARRAAR